MTTPSRSLSAFPALVRCTGIASLLLCASVSAQAAVDDDEDFNAVLSREKDPHHINDWRLGYSMLPANANISILDKGNDSNPANYKRDTNWDKTGRTGLMWMTPLSGLSEDGDFILGLELSTNHCVIDTSINSPEIDMRSYQLTVHPGMAWLLDEQFHIELNPYVGVGQAQFKQSLAGDGSALYWELGFRAAAYYTWRNGIQLGLQTGYMYGKTSGEMSGNGTFDTDIEIQGVTLGIQIGYRL